MEAVLARSRELGFLGPGPVSAHVDHAERLAAVVEALVPTLRPGPAPGEPQAQGAVLVSPPASVPGGGARVAASVGPGAGASAGGVAVAELGSGGGVPGLVLAVRWLASRWLFIESIGRRTEFLVDACQELGLAERVEVFHGRAERAGHDPRLRGSFDLVVARSFGPPAVTAECGAPLLRTGGLLVVTEPPEGGSANRWPDKGLSLLGLERSARSFPEIPVTVLVQTARCPDRFPRREGMPAKRPLFSSGPDRGGGAGSGAG